MQESYHKLSTIERQKLFTVFRQSKFYNFVRFLNHLEELYNGDYGRAIQEDFKKVQKCYNESGNRNKTSNKK